LKKLFLHIGFPKTGTTALQLSLRKNAARLREQGVFFPADPAHSFMQETQHLPLAAAVPGRPMPFLSSAKRSVVDRAYDDLFDWVARKRAETVVLSSEAFGGVDMGPKKAQWLRDAFDGYDVTIIAYIRRQDDHLLSTYQEMIKAGGTERFAFDSYKTRRPLFFARRLMPWRKAFGVENVVVRPFARSFWPNGDLFSDFLRVIGVDPIGMVPAENNNESLDFRAIELLRRFNLLSAQRGGATMTPYERRHHGYSKLAAQLPKVLADGATYRKAALSSEQAEEIRLFFREDNRKALRMTGIGVDRFFPPVAPGRPAMLPPDSVEDELLLRLLWGMINPQSVAEFQFPDVQR